MELKPLLILFAVTASSVAQWDPHFTSGRQTIVHLFEWKWSTIAEECERFLAPFGYGGVQVSPVTENAVVSSPSRPWWERYQPVSYSVLNTRSGSQQEFADMVRRCNAVGVRIYVDLVVNHMTGSGMAGQGTGGSNYNAGIKQFPEYSAQDFNARSKCPSSSGGIEDYSNPNQVRNCELASLTDLDQSQEYVRGHIAALMNNLTGMGVAGFRVDAAKHMWPADMGNIFGRLNNLPTGHGFPANAKPFIYQEVIDMSDGEAIPGSQYFSLGRVTDFRYGMQLANAFRGGNALKYLKNWGTEWGLYPEGNNLVFIDNHDNQRGHGGGGSVLTFRDARQYKMATAFMLAHPNGVTRVMSSYYWETNFQGGEDLNNWVGPPNNNGQITPPTINPDLTCGNGWICEHRWSSIYNMVKFRNVVAGTALNDWWDNDSNQIAFCRGGKGFVAINGDSSPLSAKLQTCLPAGQYRDVIYGSTVTVGSDGKADIYVSNESDVPVLAIHLESRL